MSTAGIVALGVAIGLVAGAAIAFFFAEDATEGWSLGGLTFVIVGGLAICIPLAVRSQNSWEHWCAEQGGHVTSHTSSNPVVTVGANGQTGVGVSTDTTYYCLSADGRVLDVE